MEIARAGEEVCIKIENTTGEAPKLYGRHFTHQDTLVSRVCFSKIYFQTYTIRDLQEIFIYTSRIVLVLSAVN